MNMTVDLVEKPTLTLEEVKRFVTEHRVKQEVYWAAGTESMTFIANWIFNNQNLIEVRSILNSGNVHVDMIYLTRD